MHAQVEANSVLCVANFPSNTGYAWDFIEALYAGVAERASDQGIDTFVAYPELAAPPRTLSGSPACAVRLPLDLNRPGQVLRLLRFVRTHSVGAVYLSDRPTWHPVYGLLRVAGVDWIVVHEHSSGARTAATGIRGVLKRASRKFPALMVDRVIAVSEYVAARIRSVDRVPASRIVRVWNSVNVPAEPLREAPAFLAEHGIPSSRPLICCAGRLTREKGFDHLFRAFDRALDSMRPDEPWPLLVCMGSGPVEDELRSLAHSLKHGRDIRMLGYVANPMRVLAAGQVAVVPSVWEEAFGLAALEPLACGVPVIASAAGGLPEIVEHGRTGLLVPPGDEVALASALLELIRDPARCRRMGALGRERARTDFDFRTAVAKVTQVVLEPIASSRAAARARARDLSERSPS
ncbi:MAG: glycosyltransferase family 4 protein [Gemmatimonadota bacterium]